MALTITLNGQKKTLNGPTRFTLVTLVDELRLQPDRVAIELNDAIVSRSRWSETFLAEDDRVELVQFVGGGAFVSCSKSLSQRSP